MLWQRARVIESKQTRIAEINVINSMLLRMSWSARLLYNILEIQSINWVFYWVFDKLANVFFLSFFFVRYVCCCRFCLLLVCIANDYAFCFFSTQQTAHVISHTWIEDAINFCDRRADNNYYLCDLFIVLLLLFFGAEVTLWSIGKSNKKIKCMFFSWNSLSYMYNVSELVSKKHFEDFNLWFSNIILWLRMASNGNAVYCLNADFRSRTFIWAM